MASKSRLGKGLGALFPALPGEHEAADKVESQHGADDHRVGATASAGEKTTATKVAATPATQTAAAKKSATVKPEPTAKPATATKLESQTADESSTNQPYVERKRPAVPAVQDSVPEMHSPLTASSSRKSKRASMPGLGDIAHHPSDMFFGAPAVPTVLPGLDAHDAGSSAAADKVADATAPGSKPAAQKNAVAAQGKGTSAQTRNSEAKADDKDKEPELKPVAGGYLAELKVTDIVPNAQQPRTVFDEDELNELSASISEVGVLQPIVVRKKPDVSRETSATNADKTDSADVSRETSTASASSAHYELIMGERRWRASQLAGLTTIPAIVKTTTDDEMLRDALLENLHRVALNPLEEAAAYQQMIDEFGLTQAELSKSISKSRPQIANTLRLLNLPASVQKKVAAGVLSAGHARALLALNDESEMEKLATRIIGEGLSVRSAEEIVAMKNAESDAPKKPRANKNNPWAGSPILNNLENHFDTKVSIKGTQKHGRIEIVFSSPEDMDRILGLLMPAADKPKSNWV
ncbi:chromosome partitioning protein ParB [Bifidobacterium goeldii]|uniref:Chromosome partitioning protein ParB n=1 Tax=Bifidobacterium goeldii TaxID=2306975 RepID=A0A430FH85_9BIFI|nr:ParB/RepB/Spo0J family partition protein [Bifidobacterium goeldii]RSX52151.1 chromosome partitioning protein ParB [Bifidobacterium goeldii]